MGNTNIGDIIAHWSIEHAAEERKAHLDWLNHFLKHTGLSKYLSARLRKGIECWQLGFPATRIDLVLRNPAPAFRNRRTGGRITGLTRIHLNFCKNAGVFSLEKHIAEVYPMTKTCKNADDAERITAWKGWEGTSCHVSLVTDGHEYGYRCRNSSLYCGRPGDCFKYGADWNEVNNQLADVLYGIIRGDLGF